MSPFPSELLKEATKKNHQELEKTMILQLRGIQINDEYIKFLQVFYGYFGALEKRIDLFIPDGGHTGDFQRRKSERLKDDIISLGGSIPEKAGKESLPVIEGYLQAFGALYVLEGSTLGGQVIVKMLQRQLKSSENTGFTFFYGYGDDTLLNWQSFKNIINGQIHSDEIHQMIRAADETFLKFKQWFEKHYPESNKL